MEFDPSAQSSAAQVLAFKTPRFAVSAPTAVVVALIGFATAWMAKPSGPVVALSDADRSALQKCEGMSAQIEAVARKQENFQNWIEPQIGVILVQLNARAYVQPAAPAPPAVPPR